MGSSRTKLLLGTRETFGELLGLIDAAQSRLWVSVAFFVPDFRFDVGGGTEHGAGFFDALQTAARRGVDVRVIFWSAVFEGKGNAEAESSVFADTAEHRSLCEQHMPACKVLFDPSPSRVHCHHQKSWICDDVSLIGGINLELQPEFPTTTGEGWLPARYDNYLRIDDAALCLEHRQFFAARWNCSPGFVPDEHAALSEHELAAVSGDTSLAAREAHGTSAGVAKASLRLLANVVEGHYLPPATAGQTDLSDGRAQIVEWYLEAIRASEHSVLVESTHFGHTPILRALLDAAERGVQVVYTHGPLHAPVVRKEIAKFRALYYAAGGDTEKILAQAGRYTEVWQLGLALSRHPNFTSLCVCDGGLRNPGAAAAVRAASGLPALPTIAGSSHPGVGNTPWLLHSKLTVVDCERFTTGSANHVDISMERTQDCGHTELNVGVQGQAATREVLRKLLGFLLVDEWDTTMLDDGAGGREQQAAREVATALAERGVANRARWECGEPVVGRVVETDWEWYYLRAKVDGGKHDELALFEGWAAGAAAAGM